MAATHQITQTPTGLGARLAGFIQARRDDYAKWRLYRETLSELQNLSRRELADLGLHRSELKRIALQAAYDQ